MIAIFKASMCFYFVVLWCVVDVVFLAFGFCRFIRINSAL